MFRRKVHCDIPEPPKPPKFDELIEDLEHAPDDDILFQVMQQAISPECEKSSDGVYERAVEILQNNSEVETAMKKLMDSESKLKQTSSQLKKELENIEGRTRFNFNAK